MKPKVAVVGRDSSEEMFLKRGWELVSLLGGEPDLIQFTGGEDVGPALYGQKRNPHTYTNPYRDAKEVEIYKTYLGKAAFAGICRGGQLLNVLNGGSLYQHVDNHQRGHIALDIESGGEVLVSSVHHQMMIPPPEGRVLLVARQSSVRYVEENAIKRAENEDDVEAVFFEKTRSLCFQPHPEYHRFDHPCQDLYFHYLKHHLNLG